MSDGPPVAQRDPTPHITPDEAIARCRQVLDAAWSLLGCLGGHIILRPGHRPEHTTAYYLDRLRADLAPLLTAPALRSSLLTDVAQSVHNLNDLLAELQREPGYCDAETGEPIPPRAWCRSFRAATNRLREALRTLASHATTEHSTAPPAAPATPPTGQLSGTGETPPADLADLSEVERAVLDVLAGGVSLKGATIAHRTPGYSYDYIRKALAGMVRRGLLLKDRDGYRRRV